VSVSADKPLTDVEAFKQAQRGGDYNALSGSKDVDLSYVLSSKKSDKTYVDLRQVDARTYLKVDARAIVELSGEDASAVDDMIDTAPPEMKVAKDLLSGTWVSLDAKLLEEFAKAGGQPAGTPSGVPSGVPSAMPSLDPKAVEGVLGSLKDVIAKNLVLEDRGTLGGLDQIRVSVPARGLAEGFLKAVKPLAKDLPQIAELPDAVPSDIPDRKIGADLFLKNGTLSAVTLDLAQFAEEAGPEVHFPVKVTFGHDVPAIDTPTGAVEVTKQDLDNLVTAFADEGEDDESAGPNTLGDAPPLTDAQLQELVAAGMDRAEAIEMNKLGFTFEDLKKFGPPKA